MDTKSAQLTSAPESTGDTNMCKPLGAEFTLQAVLIRAGLAQAPEPKAYSKTYTSREIDAAKTVLHRLLAAKAPVTPRDETTIYEY
jgi:hypothetical protein